MKTVITKYGYIRGCHVIKIQRSFTQLMGTIGVYTCPSTAVTVDHASGIIRNDPNHRMTGRVFQLNCDSGGIKLGDSYYEIGTLGSIVSTLVKCVTIVLNFIDHEFEIHYDDINKCKWPLTVDGRDICYPYYESTQPNLHVVLMASIDTTPVSSLADYLIPSTSPMTVLSTSLPSPTAATIVPLLPPSAIATIIAATTVAEKKATITIPETKTTTTTTTTMLSVSSSSLPSSIPTSVTIMNGIVYPSTMTDPPSSNSNEWMSIDSMNHWQLRQYNQRAVATSDRYV
jgi:hypothetical protein